MSSAVAAVRSSLTLARDLTVRRLGFGALRITGPGCVGPPPDRETAKRLLRRVVELGVELIDTADSYGPEVSEQLIAEALYPYPKNLVIVNQGWGLARVRCVMEPRPTPG